MSDNAFGAFVPGARAHCAATGRGVLDGTRLAVKDLIDVAGVVTGGGNPDWAARHAPAGRHARAVQQLLDAGATLIGKTVTDELAFSLEGENVHYGTPRNPRAPGRLPGGSSSGSAVAVAAGAADIALGTDTGGSVRIPAAFCGIFGFRPTHGRVSVDGVLPFAPTLDTVGWFAADGLRLRQLGSVLLDGPCGKVLNSLHWVQDIAALADDDVRDAVQWAAATLRLGEPVHVLPPQGPASLLAAYATLQGDEIRQSLGEWIRHNRPRFGAAIASRFEGVFRIDPADVLRWARWRDGERHRIDELLGDTAWVFPTSPHPALSLGATAAERERFYAMALAINALASLAGLPQVTLPAGRVRGAPIALSVLGPRGSDEALLALAGNWPNDLSAA